MTTTITGIELDYARDPSEAMLRVGIHGRFTVNIMANVDGNSVVLFQGNKITLRKSRAGEWYIMEPYEEYEKDGEKKKAYFFKLFSGMERDARDKMVKVIIDKAKEQFDVANQAVPASATRAVPASATSATNNIEEDPFA
jgi:hypothetical protein